MAMENVLPAFLVITLISVLVRYLTKLKSGDTSDSIPGVTPSMVETVHTAFPHIPTPDIIYHLSKSRSAQATSDEILQRGFLPPPPTPFHIPPTLLPSPPTPSSPSNPSVPSPNPGSASASGKTQNASSLIERYGLGTRLPSRKGKEREPGLGSGVSANQGEAAEQGAGKVGRGGGKWEDTREKRERDLRERKERMILEARRRMLEKQSEQEAA